jgi:hypothetical protein
MIMVRDLLGWKMRRNCISFRLNVALTKAHRETSGEPLCMGYATFRNDCFSFATEGFTYAGVNDPHASLSRRRDFFVPFSKRP